MSKCPFCGGTAGFVYDMTVRYSQWCTWDGKAVDAEAGTGGWEAKTAECVDCGKRFNRDSLFADEEWLG